MKNLKINVPEGYEIDKEASTFENIVFKKKEPCLPKRWEELNTIDGYFVSTHSDIVSVGEGYSLNILNDSSPNKNVFATKEQAEAALAMAQLSQLMKVYNDGWEPDWTDFFQKKFVIHFSKDRLLKFHSIYSRHFLAFKDVITRDLFLENFQDLIIKAKPLL